jgi:hypothetical protein
MENAGFIQEIEQAAKELQTLFKETKSSQVPPSKM